MPLAATPALVPWHYAVLATLDELGPVSQAELSCRTGIYRSDLVAVIHELADRGLVERSPNPADRRRNLITLTKEGHRQLLRLDKLLADVENDVLAPLTPPARAPRPTAHDPPEPPPPEHLRTSFATDRRGDHGALR